MGTSGKDERDRQTRMAIFATTQWSNVLQAGLDSSQEKTRAMETLCRAYWYPLYAFIRRLGHSPPDAQDMTQSFFAYLLEKEIISKARESGCHFRSFLIGSLKNFMANEYRRKRTAKRGGDAPIVSFDSEVAENRYADSLMTADNPQTIYERAWAVAILDQSLKQLELEYVTAHKKTVFDALHVFLQGERRERSYAEVAASLDMREGAVKVAVHRLRQRYRELLRSAVAGTVANPLDVDEELQHLFRVLSR